MSYYINETDRLSNEYPGIFDAANKNFYTIGRQRPTQERIIPLPSNLFVAAYLRPFGAWIDADSRSNGYNEGDLIEQPAYIIESILRDELGLTSNEIDYASFDVVGNTTNGKRDNWVFARSIFSIENSIEVISRLCFESHCMLFENSNGKYSLIALDTDTSTTNLITQSQIIGSPSISRTKSIFNQYNIGYAYNYGNGNFEKLITVNETISTLTSNTFTPANFTPDEDSGIVLYGANASTSLCGISQSRYLRINLFQEDLLWHYNLATVNLFVKKLIEWNYSPKIVIQLKGWAGKSFTTGYKHFISYELGDQCKVSHQLLDPDISSVYIFMVVGKSIDISSNEVTLTLMQMR